MENKQDIDKVSQGLVAVINKLLLIIAVLVFGFLAIPFAYYYSIQPEKPKEQKKETANKAVGSVTERDAGVTYWTAVDINTLPDGQQKDQVVYGKELIAHTSKYLGPKGSVMQVSNGLNCQNCHLQAGTAVYGNNYGAVASLYPKFRARSGKIEDLLKRVNDCLERSLNGKSLDSNNKEMRAIMAYINFIGRDVPKGKKAEGSGFKELAYLERAADPEMGKSVFTAKCQSCHQADGQGVFNADKTEYTFPALWGKNSYNDGAGLYRIISFAKYVKYNMPLGVTHTNTQLSDEEAWDVAAFVNSQPRPHINEPKDWPDISKKPADHPFGPYADGFKEKQHKFGPFKPIVTEQLKREDAAKQKTIAVSTKKKGG